MDDPKKTHSEVKEPTISVRYLADYMAASERKKRTIVAGCKFKPLARLLQHKEARIVVAASLRDDNATAESLKARAELIRNKLADDEFDEDTNEANADYVERFSKVFDSVELPGGEILPGKRFPATKVNGVRVTWESNLTLRRLTKTNKLRRGSLMLRYAKGKALDEAVAGYQSAAIFGLLGQFADEDGAEVERALCLTLDAYSGKLYAAPGSSISIFANMKAACQTIAEWWPNIEPPNDAVL